MLHRLIYTSRARQALPLDLKDILASSRTHNARVGVTGALCFLDGVYLQCLEGDGRVLAELYKFTRLDERHTDAKLVSLESTGHRLFAGWSMGLMTWSDETQGIFEYFNPGQPFDLYDAAPAKAKLLIETFAASRNWAEV